MYKIGFWNYVDCGVLDVKKSVNDWKSLGMNMPMSFEYNPERHKKSDVIEQLNECKESGMKLIVCDSRTNFRLLKNVTADEFEKGVKEAVKDFADYEAFFGFHIGDEPNKNEWQIAIDAYRICLKYAPKSTPFINFLPYWDEDNFKDMLGVDAEHYGELLESFVKQTGAKMIGYDYYGQCAYFERERFVDVYFKNLAIFGKVAYDNQIELYVSQLSVGHWSLTVPDEDLIKWQISTAIAYGAKGLMWFFVYERKLDGSYRLPPIDLFWERTETFSRLSRQNRIFLAYYADALDRLKFDKVWNYGKSYGGTELFDFNEDIKSIDVIINETPLSVSRFTDEQGYASYYIVNLSQTEPTAISFSLAEELKEYEGKQWIAPGQAILMLNKNSVKK